MFSIEEIFAAFTETFINEYKRITDYNHMSPAKQEEQDGHMSF